MTASPPRTRWIRNLGLVVIFVAVGGLVRAVRGDTGPGSQHNDPGPGNCSHKHGGFNTSYCDGNNGGDGAACTVNGKTGTCKTERQQCYCVSDGGIAVVDAGVKPIGDAEPLGFGGADESAAP